MVDTNDEWIRTRTGIKTRHVVEPGTPTSVLAARAAQEALDRRGVAPSEVDLIIVATVTPDMMFPATACLVQDKLKATRAWGFDISAACSGFLYALTMGAQFVENGTHKKVLVIGRGRDDLDPRLRGPRHLRALRGRGGSGAARARRRRDRDPRLHATRWTARGAAISTCPRVAACARPPTRRWTRSSTTSTRRGRTSSSTRCASSRKRAHRLLERNHVGIGDVDLFVAHQANIRIIDAAKERLGLPEEKVVKNIHEYGNTTAGTIPLALGTALDQKRLKKGDLVLMAAVGAGFTVGSVLMRWSGVDWS